MSGEDETSATLKWVEMSEGMCDHVDNLYMAKKFLVKEINVNTNLKKLKKKKKRSVRMLLSPWQPKRQQMFIHIWAYVFKK